MTIRFDTDSDQIDQAKQRLLALEQEINNRLKLLSQDIAKEAVSILTEPPQPGAGNFPPEPYWERGVGMHKGGKLTELSYQYSNSAERWKYETSVADGAVVTKASTLIPYAPYLGDPLLQAKLQGNKGWATTDKVVQAIEPMADALLSQTIDQVVDSFR